MPRRAHHAEERAKDYRTEGALHSQESYLRFSHAVDQLKGEKSKYSARAGRRYDREHEDHAALASSITRVESTPLEKPKGWPGVMEQAQARGALVAIVCQATIRQDRPTGDAAGSE